MSNVVALYLLIFVTFNRVLVGVSVAGLVFASIINVLFSHSRRDPAHDS